MALVDEILIRARAGKGGDGVVRWLHLKGKEFGGPSGGNGGRGGDVIVRAVRDLNVLYQYRGRGTLSAEDGAPGGGKRMTGKDGESLILTLPVGSRITVKEYDRFFEILQEGEEIVVLSGGKGGKGNAEFKSSVNQYPDKATHGEEGENGSLFIELQMIADIGIIGFPNAGKSSLLNTLTGAGSRVGEYPFTTLEPHLGVFHKYVLADIPGLIEGAAEGRGLGHSFLRHIKRTRIILHCISSEEKEVSRQYENIRKEIAIFDPALSKKREIIFLTKIDNVPKEEKKKKKKELERYGEVIPFSILDDEVVREAGKSLSKVLSGAQ